MGNLWCDHVDNVGRVHWATGVKKKEFFSKKAAEPISESPENDRTERLEKHLKMVTNQLNTALQDLVEYKNLYISQEKKINQNFNGMPEIGTYKKKQNCVNYDVI